MDVLERAKQEAHIILPHMKSRGCDDLGSSVAPLGGSSLSSAMERSFSHTVQIAIPADNIPSKTSCK